MHRNATNEHHVIDEHIIPLYFRISDRGDARKPASEYASFNCTFFCAECPKNCALLFPRKR